MPKGGARAVSGPPPDPNAAARERDSHEWVTLPLAGRQGPAPKWPFPDDPPSKTEADMWGKQWRTPQAVMWERLGLHHHVALYVRTLLGAAEPGAPAAALTSVRQLSDSLGISVPGMRYNRWRVVDTSQHDYSLPEIGETTPRPTRRGSVRSRMTVVPPPDDDDE